MVTTGRGIDGATGDVTTSSVTHTARSVIAIVSSWILRCRHPIIMVTIHIGVICNETTFKSGPTITISSGTKDIGIYMSGIISRLCPAIISAHINTAITSSLSGVATIGQVSHHPALTSKLLDFVSFAIPGVDKTYRICSSIFTIDKRKAEDLKESLDECDNLIKAGIDVKVCSDNTLEGEKTLRIFPIDQVKGMEFEAVFFYDIDDIESTSLINKYLYVGLSRASMYLAVTSNGRSEKISKMLQNYFAVNETW